MNLDNLNLIDLLPQILKTDKTSIALCNVLQPYFNQLKQDNLSIILYANIKNLDAKILDELAYQLHSDQYDFSTTIEEKRKVIKSTIKVHRYKGTPYAVKEAVNAIFNGNATLKEWFEYGANPFLFKVEVAADKIDVDLALQKKAERAIEISKNARSKLDAIIWIDPVELETNSYIGISILISDEIKIN